MAVNRVGGDKLVLDKQQITAGADLADKTLVLVAGTLPANAAGVVYGVVEKDTPNGEYATVKTYGILEVIATGAVTAGAFVEVLQGSIYANINGVSTSITGAGVVDYSAGVKIGKALTGSDAGGTVLVAIGFSTL